MGRNDLKSLRRGDRNTTLDERNQLLEFYIAITFLRNPCDDFAKCC